MSRGGKVINPLTLYLNIFLNLLLPCIQFFVKCSLELNNAAVAFHDPHIIKSLGRGFGSLQNTITYSKKGKSDVMTKSPYCGSDFPKEMRHASCAELCNVLLGIHTKVRYTAT